MIGRFCVLLLCLSFLAASPLRKRYMGETTLKLTRVTRGFRPAEMDIQLTTLDNDKVDLRLKRNDNVNPDATMFVGEEGEIKTLQQTKRENFAAYMDTESAASFLVHTEMNIDGTLKRKFQGRFQRGNKDWTIERDDNKKDAKRDENLEDNAETYSLYMRDIGELNFEDDVRYPPGEGPVEQIIDLTGQGLTNPGGKKIVYTVEFMFFLDYSIYEYHLRLQNNDPDKAIEMIRWGYSQIANGMDLRYRSIEAPDFEIHVQLAGFYIAKTPDMSPWTYDRNVRIPGRDGVDYADVYKALDLFEEWVGENEKDLKHFDQATAFSRMKLFSGTNRDGSRRTISGLADIKGVCGPLRCAINHEHGEYGSIQTGAHEMGHNLGAQHDGTKNGCTGKDQYVMASAPRSLNDVTYDKALTFSRCSVQYFRDYMNQMTMEGTNCLLDSPEMEYKESFLEALKVLPGQKITPDQQCKFIIGTTSYYCAGDADATICSLLKCYNPEKYKCMTISEVRAFPGTTCGNKKWCTEGGRCEESEFAPEAAETCLYGDFKGKFGDGTKCDAVNRTPRMCYAERNAQCCETCASLKDDSKPGCEFGDHETFCANTKKEECYTESVRKSCCKKCADFNTGETGCEYGDKAQWCRTMKSSQCYVDGKTCCESCKRFDTGIAGCQYGDKTSWCSSVQRKSCYTDEANCCESCNRLKTGISGCQYGDKDQSCKRDDCKDSYYWKSCCSTCQSEITAAGGGKKEPEKGGGEPDTSDGGDTSGKPDGGNSGCKDKASWCSTMHPSGCYNAVTRDTCCGSCPTYLTTNSGCEYGDKASWCQGLEMSKCSYLAKDCCATCP